jgi:uncharacterized protein YndB with AHSA1/START domain
MTLPVLTKSVAVACAPAEAFQLFTAGISSWWPLATHSVFAHEALSCVFEPHVGGRVYERSASGGQAWWGTVFLIEPGRRLFLTWHPGRPPLTAQELRLHFVASEGGTRVELEHLGWEALGERAQETRKHYDTGWDEVLVSCFAACANRRHRPPPVAG